MRQIAIGLFLLGVLALVILPAVYADGLLHPSAAPQTTRTYPGPAPCNTTLQACVSAASNGDVISVTAGTYITNQINITRSIRLQGAGAGSTILQANGAHGVINIGGTKSGSRGFSAAAQCAEKGRKRR